MRNFKVLADAVAALGQFGYKPVAANTVDGRVLYGFTKGTGKQARHAVVAQGKRGFIVKFI